MTQDNASDGSTTTSDAQGTGRGAAPWVSTLALLLGLALLGYGIYRLVQFGDYAIAAAGVLAVVIALAASAVVSAVLHAARQQAAVSERAVDTTRELRNSVGAVVSAAQKVAENTRISERGKQVAYRDRDREVVRRAIEEDLLKGDYASARLLADEFEKAFGYRNEAERFREEIRRRLDDARGHEIGDATSRVDDLCDAERWSDAFAEADRLINKYDNDMRVRLLRTKIEERRQQRKVDLVSQFRDAHSSGDADRGSDLLKQLDAYLTPDEGRQLQDEAREVFRDKLMKLKERYSEAIHSRDFSEALRLGGIIRRDYPNSTLAKEVSGMEARLREKVGVAPEEEPAPI